MTTTSTIEKFALPDVGEGLTEADILTWHVEVGEVVEVNQPLVDIETAKSVVELPSPFAGRVVELLVAVGATVPVGDDIIAIATSEVASSGAQVRDTQDADEPQLLVGYGARESSPRRRPGPGSRAGATRRPAADPVTERSSSTDSSSADASPARIRAKASPPVRKLARALGVDLPSLVASGSGGIVSRDDVLRAAPEVEAHRAVAPAQVSPRTQDEPAHRDGDVRVPVKGVRKHTAAAMVRSAFTAPHVTEFVTVDVTETLALKEAFSSRRDFRDVRLTPLTFVARAFVRALQRTPQANAQWDEAAQEIVLRRDVNLGIAAATPRGLLVPNIACAQHLGLRELADRISQLAATARAGETPPQAMAGGTATITNVGVFGVDTGTPILNPGETTILAVGAVRRTPWVLRREGVESIEPRSVMQLSLSFDHRVLDGQQGSQVLADTAAVLEDPLTYVL